MQHLGNKRIASDADLAFVFGRALHHAPGDDGNDDENWQRDEQHPHHGRGDNIDDANKENRERQIGQQHGGRAGEGIAHHFGIAKEGLPEAGRAALQGAQRQGGKLVVERAPERNIDSERHPLQHAAACLANDKIEHQRGQYTDQ